MNTPPKNEAYYEKLKAHQNTSALGVGWKSQNSQRIRFTQLANLFSKKKFSVNDIGCGKGHLFEFLSTDLHIDIQYTGYDILESMVAGAKELYGDSPKARFIHIAQMESIERADYSVSSGIFNLKGEHREAYWLNYILSAIDIMDQKSGQGFAFNMLTQYSNHDCMKPDLFYADPCFFFDFCKKKYSRNVALLHDYNEYDFTIIVRK